MGWMKDGKPIKNPENLSSNFDKLTQLEKLERIRNEIETQMMFLNMLVQFRDPFPSKDSPMPEIENDKQKAIEYIKDLKNEADKITKIEEKSKIERDPKKFEEEVDAIETSFETKNEKVKELRKELPAKVQNEIIDLLTKQIKNSNDESKHFAIKMTFLGIGVGAILGFLSSYYVAILTSPKLPTVIFTNGTVVFP